MDKFIIIICTAALIGNMILDIRVIRTNKERIKITKEQLSRWDEVGGKLDQNTRIQKARLEELKFHRRKMDTLNRKLTILNKANYKKY